VILAAVAAVVVLLVGAITWVAVASSHDDASKATVVPVAVRDGGPRVGDVAPDFTLTTLDGKTVRLADYRGRPVVLNFWASYCHPCREEFPLFRRQLAQQPGDFVVLGVDTKDIESDAKNFAEEQKATWPIGFDETNAVAKAYGVAAVPQTFFIRPDGTVALRYYAQIPDAKFPAALATTTATPKA
jgi:cytochrome c biogenesis protein CcmG/thiol:disulfide interchange protein DsbE